MSECKTKYRAEAAAHSVVAIVIGAVAVTLLSIVSSCEMKQQELRTSQIINANDLKRELAEKGMSAEEIACVSEPSADVCFFPH